LGFSSFYLEKFKVLQVGEEEHHQVVEVELFLGEEGVVEDLLS
jgi:hypothetical protein